MWGGWSRVRSVTCNYIDRSEVGKRGFIFYWRLQHGAGEGRVKTREGRGVVGGKTDPLQWREDTSWGSKRTGCKSYRKDSRLNFVKEQKTINQRRDGCGNQRIRSPKKCPCSVTRLFPQIQMLQYSEPPSSIINVTYKMFIGSGDMIFSERF